MKTAFTIIGLLILLFASVAFLFKFMKGAGKRNNAYDKIMDESLDPLITDFQSIEISKCRAFDNHILVRKKNCHGALCVFTGSDNLKDFLNGVTIQEASEIIYVHQNFKRIWNTL